MNKLSNPFISHHQCMMYLTNFPSLHLLETRQHLSCQCMLPVQNGPNSDIGHVCQSVSLVIFKFFYHFWMACAVLQNFCKMQCILRVFVAVRPLQGAKQERNHGFPGKRKNWKYKKLYMGSDCFAISASFIPVVLHSVYKPKVDLFLDGTCHSFSPSLDISCLCGWQNQDTLDDCPEILWFWSPLQWDYHKI